MPVSVQRRAPGSPIVDSRKLRHIAERMLFELDLSSAELSVLLTNDHEIERLNAEHRRKKQPTDVLAFAMEEGVGTPAPGPMRLLGDVVISVDTAARQAQKKRHSLLDEVTFLLAHGLLHLVGYDHQTDAEERRMNAMTRRLVSASAGRKPAR